MLSGSLGMNFCSKVSQARCKGDQAILQLDEEYKVSIISLLLFMVVTMKWGRYAMHNGVKSFLQSYPFFKTNTYSKDISSILAPILIQNRGVSIYKKNKNVGVFLPKFMKLLFYGPHRIFFQTTDQMGMNYRS